MVDFNGYRCRNCKHFHHAGSISYSIDGKCGKLLDQLSNFIGTYCKCSKWESSDNLRYLEDKYREKHGV